MRCIGCGETGPPVSVGINEGPLKTVSVTVASNISCTASGANPAARITWLKDGEQIEDGDKISTMPSPDPSMKLWDTKSFLLVTPALEDHGAIFECQAINAAIAEPMVQTLTLDVQHPPVVLVESIPSDIKEGISILLQCVVDANPRGVFYQWSKNGEPIPGDTNQIELSLEKSDNQAVVMCMASNSIGTSEGSLTLDVKYGPRFVDIPGETSVDEGEMAQLECSADGNPPATIKWTRIGSRATLSTMQKLQFDSVQSSDVGLYICQATVEGFDPIESYGRVDINSEC
ncbi:putative kin of IRRE-like protein 3 [Apostichopus japonicus]|uniref:Putative kin of IRRE-like protein 3 n=1 Tax=Stichopus japonicus TaxID=307972 RepID=A0A2G8LBZ2_STIJA|nr:putative kin of IRRE-like protein 3 [Apostichopus japonicus]